MSCRQLRKAVCIVVPSATAAATCTLHRTPAPLRNSCNGACAEDVATLDSFLGSSKREASTTREQKGSGSPAKIERATHAELLTPAPDVANSHALPASLVRQVDNATDQSSNLTGQAAAQAQDQSARASSRSGARTQDATAQGQSASMRTRFGANFAQAEDAGLHKQHASPQAKTDAQSARAQSVQAQDAKAQGEKEQDQRASADTSSGEQSAKAQAQYQNAQEQSASVCTTAAAEPEESAISSLLQRATNARGRHQKRNFDRVRGNHKVQNQDVSSSTASARRSRSNTSNAVTWRFAGETGAGVAGEMKQDKPADQRLSRSADATLDSAAHAKEDALQDTRHRNSNGAQDLKSVLQKGVNPPANALSWFLGARAKPAPKEAVTDKESQTAAAPGSTTSTSSADEQRSSEVSKAERAAAANSSSNDKRRNSGASKTDKAASTPAVDEESKQSEAQKPAESSDQSFIDRSSQQRRSSASGLGQQRSPLVEQEHKHLPAMPSKPPPGVMSLQDIKEQMQGQTLGKPSEFLEVRPPLHQREQSHYQFTKALSHQSSHLSAPVCMCSTFFNPGERLLTIIVSFVMCVRWWCRRCTLLCKVKRSNCTFPSARSAESRLPLPRHSSAHCYSLLLRLHRTVRLVGWAMLLPACQWLWRSVATGLPSLPPGTAHVSETR